MTANTSPIFSRLGDVQWSTTTLATGTNTYDGTNANTVLVFTADATNGGFIRSLRFKPIGTNVATVARVFINNGSTNSTAANNVFYGEYSLQATTASSSAALLDGEYPMGIALPAGYRVYVLIATTVAAGWVVSAVAGKY